jgi:hypothetical protein
MKLNILRQTIITIFAALAVTGIVYAQSSTAVQRNAYEVRCIDRNKSLFMIIYEKGDKLDGGYLYIENIKVGTLIATNAGTDVIRAKIYGNTSNTGFEIQKSGVLFTVDYTPGSAKRVEVCKASYKYFR